MAKEVENKIFALFQDWTEKRSDSTFANVKAIFLLHWTGIAYFFFKEVNRFLTFSFAHPDQHAVHKTEHALTRLRTFCAQWQNRIPNISRCDMCRSPRWLRAGPRRMRIMSHRFHTTCCAMFGQCAISKISCVLCVGRDQILFFPISINP